MTDALFERLLYEEESTTLDFKKEQYRFVKASDEDKSELLKDILGFANAWRRSEAFILIGVEDVRGGRGNVVGIPATDHLDDHSLQQFVNNLTNRPVRFHYEAFGFEGKQVGVIRIEEQTRPLYAKRDYGKLKKNEVYVRRGSSTDPTKPATLDEIAQMGSGQSAGSKEPVLSVQFAAVDREQPLGERIEWSGEFCEMPEFKSIPKLDDRPAPVRLPGGQTFHLPDLSSLGMHDRLNKDYYHDLANYLFVRRLVKRVRLVVANTSEVPATEVRLEIRATNGQGFGIVDDSEIPDAPKRRESLLASPALGKIRFRPAFRQPGRVDIDKNDHETKVEIECGNLQPGRKIWTDAFYMGIGQSGEVKLTGHLYAANLPQPQEFTLAVNATVNRTAITVEELVALGKQEHRSDEE
jgi:hypothetical protein